MAVDEEEEWVVLQLECGQTDIISHRARKRERERREVESTFGTKPAFKSSLLVMLFTAFPYFFPSYARVCIFVSAYIYWDTVVLFIIQIRLKKP